MNASPLPKISLVTPNFNDGHFLEATLNSVLQQGYPNLEYLVLDGGSSDGSQEIIRKYEDRLTYWHSMPDRGMYDAISTGLNRSTGEIMGWLNSDDMHYPWTLKTVGEIFASFPQVEWISTLQLGGWDWYGCAVPFFQNRGFSKAAFLDGRYLPHQASDRRGAPSVAREYIQQESTFWRRSLWEKAGGYVSTEFGAAGDFELWSRFFQHAELYGVTSPIAGFRFQQGQQSTQIVKYSSHCVRALEAVRALENWRPNPARRVLQSLRCWQWPRGKLRLMTSYGYAGNRILREKRDSPEAYWNILPQTFI